MIGSLLIGNQLFALDAKLKKLEKLFLVCQEKKISTMTIILIGCIPDFPINRTWGCRQYDAAFFKDTPRNKAALGGLVSHQWPKD